MSRAGRPAALLLALAARHLAAGFADEAEDLCRQALAIDPAHAPAHHHLGLVLAQAGRIEPALAALRLGAALAPDWPEPWFAMGALLFDRARVEEAEAPLSHAGLLVPDNGRVLAALGAAQTLLGGLVRAEATLRRALALEPGDAAALNNLGTALRDQGRLDAAVTALEHALAVRPDFVAAHSNRLYCEQYRWGVTNARLFALHRAWDARHGGHPARPARAARDSGRPLRVGFVSPDFAVHPVGWFTVALFEHADPAEIETLCYSDRRRSDWMTLRIAAAAQGWRDTVELDHAALAEMIRDDQIDVLVDLTGHTAYNRLPVFALKPAPLQLTWAGYVGTTGLSAMDGLIADRWHAPLDQGFIERVVRLPNGYVCYTPPPDAPPVSPLPAETNGFITFGCFNTLAKLSPEVVALWSAVLARVTHSRLLMRCPPLHEPELRERLAREFAINGIARDRLILEGPVPQRFLLADYGRVDIALDPFPYAGGLTTCEALWMGVPVVTWPGETFASRHSLSHLSNMGMAGTVASSATHYLRTAMDLAHARDQLAVIRQRLRPHMAASPLCDGPRFARDFTAAVKDLWRAG